MSYQEQQLQRHGFVVIEEVLNDFQVRELGDAIAHYQGLQVTSRRKGQILGIRNLLNAIPLMRQLAESEKIGALVSIGLRSNFKVVRGIYLDKHRAANWKVAWHQDLTIAVRQRKEVSGYRSWSLKTGIEHVQPPVSVLERMLAVRIHLDDTDDTNGALKVLPGSHLMGRLNHEGIQQMKVSRDPVALSVKKGGVILMRPLLVHASSVAAAPNHRRVIHFEYAEGALDDGLEWYEASSIANLKSVIGKNQ